MAGQPRFTDGSEVTTAGYPDGMADYPKTIAPLDHVEPVSSA
jgi:hypothetical protein